MARISATDYLTIDELQPHIELMAYGDQHGPARHRYRVPGQHFLLVIAGAISARTPHGPVEGRAGDLLCFPATDLNEYGFDQPTRYIEAHIRFAPPPRHRHQLWLDGIGPLPLRIPLGTAMGRLTSILETLCCELPHHGAVHRARLSAGVWDMLAVLADVMQPEAGGQLARMDRWQRARLRLGMDLGEPLRLAELAREARASVESFIRGFKTRFGVSPGHYRNQQKLLHAAFRLRTSDGSIKELAHQLGFADAYSFTRAFRSHFGVLPSDLRAGRLTASTRSARPDRPLMLINQHILPPGGGGREFYGQFVPTPGVG